MRRNYKENYIIKKILIGYYPLESIPKERLHEAKRRLRASIICPGYELLEDGIEDVAGTYQSYDPLLRHAEVHRYDRAYYWQKYRCEKRRPGNKK